MSWRRPLPAGRVTGIDKCPLGQAFGVFHIVGMRLQRGRERGNMGDEQAANLLDLLDELLHLPIDQRRQRLSELTLSADDRSKLEGWLERARRARLPERTARSGSPDLPELLHDADGEPKPADEAHSLETVSELLNAAPAPARRARLRDQGTPRTGRHGHSLASRAGEYGSRGRAKSDGTPCCWPPHALGERGSTANSG